MGKSIDVFQPEQAAVSEWEGMLDASLQAGDISANTGATYRRGMAQFVNWLHANSKTASAAALQEWKGELLAAGMKPNTVNTWLQGVRRFYEWAVSEGRMASDPTGKVKNVKRRGSNKRHLRDALTDKEVLRTLAQPDRSTPQGKRDYAMLCLMAFCALREVELARADLADLSTVDGLPVLRVQGKGSTEKDETAVIFSDTAQDALYDWLGERGHEPGPLFPSLSIRNSGQRLDVRSVRALVKYIRQAGIVDNRKTLHSLRHSAISKVARHDILKARQVARHANIDTTMIYVHETDRLDNPGEQYIEYTNGNGK